MFRLPEPNYTNSQCDRVWPVAAPKGLGPMKKCIVMVKVPPPHPHPAAPGTGQNKAAWRGRMETWTDSRQHRQQKMPSEGHLGGAGDSSQRHRPKLVVSEIWGRRTQPPLAPAAYHPQPKYQLAEEEAC